LKDGGTSKMLDTKKRYLQIALNGDLSEGIGIISQLPSSDRILIEAGTPLIKEYGVDGIRRLKEAWQMRKSGNLETGSSKILNILAYSTYRTKISAFFEDVYIVADTKCVDRGKTEVEIAQKGGASAATVIGGAPVETINYFIDSCREAGIDSMVDMIGVDQPIKVLRQLKKIPDVVVLHRGVDEETFDRHKPIPYVQINKIRSSFNVLISIAGGDTIREVQRAIFNDANIVVVWKDFYKPTSNTQILAEEFLKEIK